jgi:hypothetical protein
MDAENLSPIVIRSRTVQPVASRYTVYAIPAHLLPSGESQSAPTLEESKIIVSRTLIFTFSVFTQVMTVRKKQNFNSTFPHAVITVFLLWTTAYSDGLDFNAMLQRSSHYRHLTNTI